MNFKKFILSLQSEQFGKITWLKRCIIPLICIYHLRRVKWPRIPAPRSNPRSILPNFITVYTVTDRYFRQGTIKRNKGQTFNFTYSKKRKTQCIISLSVVLSSIYSNQTWLRTQNNPIKKALHHLISKARTKENQTWFWTQNKTHQEGV